MEKSFPDDQNLAVFVVLVEMREVNGVTCNGSLSKRVVARNKLF